LRELIKEVSTVHYIRTVEYVEVSIEDKIREAFPENADLMLAIAKAESNLIPDAINETDEHNGCLGSFGLFQVGCVHTDDTEALLDVDTNIEYAKEVYEKQGLTAWGVYTSGAYLAYLK